MTPRRLTLILISCAGITALPVAGLAMGGGSMGSSSMPSGPSEPQYDPNVEYQNGLNALQAGKFKDAVQSFQRVTDVEPRSSTAWYYLGQSQDGAGDAKGAARSYQRAVKIDDSVGSHEALALDLIKLKQTDKASAELATLKAKQTACADTCPDAADLKSAVDAIQAALAPAGAPSAANTVPPSLSLAAPGTGDGAYVRAVSLINERRFPEALAALDKAEAAIGPHPDILTYKGYVWRHMGDWTKAEDYYRQALAMDPNHRGATEYYGELKVLEGDMAGARKLLAKLDNACDFGCAEAEELRRWIDNGGDPVT